MFSILRSKSSISSILTTPKSAKSISQPSLANKTSMTKGSKIKCLDMIRLSVYTLLALVLTACNGGGGGGGTTTSNEPELKLNSLQVSTSQTGLGAGTTLQASATGTFTDQSQSDISAQAQWSSNDTDIITIAANGLVTGVNPGTTSISASLDGVSNALTLTVYELNRIILSGFPEQLELGDSIQLSASGLYANGSSQNIDNQVTWSSNNPSAFSVSDTGELNVLSGGTAVLSATLNGVTESQTVTVVTLNSISVSPPSVAIAIESTLDLTATGIYSDNTTANLSNEVTWSSSNTGIATISNSGTLQSISEGNTTITASIDSLNATTSITVNPAELQTISIVSPTSLAAGLNSELQAIGIYNDGSTQDITNEVTWTSSDESIASIDDNALLRAIAVGNATISATKTVTTTNPSTNQSSDVTRSANAAFNVSSALVNEIIVTPSDITLAKGTSSTLIATALFSDGTNEDVTSQISWTSDNNLLAAINNAGQVNGLQTGTTQWTANFSDQSYNVAITITDPTLNSIEVSPTNQSIPSGFTEQFSVTGLYSDGSTQDLRSEVSWTSSDEAVAFIDNAENNEGLANALGAGNATITANIGDLSSSTTLSVQTASLESLELTPSTSSVAAGYTAQFRATGHYSDGNSIDLSDLVTWSSSNTSIANTTETDSVFIGRSTGNTLISAEYSGINALASLAVTNATLESIRLESPVSSIPAGYSAVLNATGVYSDASEVDISEQVTWSSNNNAVFTVDNQHNSIGTLRAISTGTATAIANLNDVSASQSITVSEATLSNIAISAGNTTLFENQTSTLQAIATYSDNTQQDISHLVSWFSSNDPTASIETNPDNSFVIQALSAGTANIQATLLTDSGLVSSNTLGVTVTLAPNATRSISLTLSPNIILNNGTDSSTVSATLSPNSDSGAIPDGTEVSFNITENGVSRIESATTSNGVASISIRSTVDGLITINASVTNGINSEAGLVSADDFSEVFYAESAAQGSYDATTQKTQAGSSLLLFMQNLSNRTFTFNSVSLKKLTLTTNENGETIPLFVDLEQSPFTDGEFTSNGQITSAEFFVFGRIFEDDIDSDSFTLTYSLTDEPTSENFEISASYRFVSQ